MKLLSVSEVVAGLVISKVVSPAALTLSELAAPYNKVVQAIAKGASLAAVESQFGQAVIEAAQMAAERSQGDGKDWVNVLHSTYHKALVAAALRRDANTLEEGDDIDVGSTMERLRQINNFDQDFKTLDQIQENREHYRESGYAPLDKGGAKLPRAGLMLIGGLPKTGKTKLIMAITQALAMVKAERSLHFSFEMPDEDWKGVILRMYPKLQPRFQKYVTLYTGSEGLDVDGWAARCHQMSAEVGGYSVITVDAGEMLLRKGVDEQGMTQLMDVGGKTARSLAKQYGKCCVIFTAHMNDGAYQGGLPKVNHLRYGRMAVAYGADILLIHNENVAWTKSKQKMLPFTAGNAWIMHPVARYGFGEDPRTGAERSAGAMEVAYSGKKGWGNKLLDYQEISAYIE